MKLPAFAVMLLISGLAWATPPSADSIERLFALTRTEKLMDSMFQSMDAMMKGTMAQSLGGQELSAAGKRAMEASRERTTAIIRDELSWEKMKSSFVQIYSETFTQEEIEGLINFYASPAGQAYLEKMPVVMQKSMEITQGRMGPMMQRVQEAVKEAAAEARAAK